MSASTLGTLETIAEQLTTLNQLIALNNDLLKATKSGGEIATSPSTEAVEEEEEEAAPAKTRGRPAGKKVASKKVAAKKAPAKKKGDDLSNMTLFKKRLFEVAEATGSEDVLPELKKFIKKCGYAGSDEIEVADRAEFLDKVKEHFTPPETEEEEEETEDASSELDDL